MKKNDALLFLFAAVSIAELLGVIFNRPTVQLIAKPLIVLSLLGYYWMNTAAVSTSLTAALAFCWAGDVLLLFQARDEIFFIAGLVAFLVGHVFYVFAYRNHRAPGGDQLLNPLQKIRFAFPILLAGTGLVTVLYPKLGSLRLPVMLYAVVLMIMVITALLRYGYCNAKSFWLVFAGALLFMASDSMLAINKFYAPFAASGVLVMVTYISAQYLIVRGLLKHL